MGLGDTPTKMPCPLVPACMLALLPAPWVLLNNVHNATCLDGDFQVVRCVFYLNTRKPEASQLAFIGQIVCRVQRLYLHGIEESQSLPENPVKLHSFARLTHALAVRFVFAPLARQCMAEL